MYTVANRIASETCELNRGEGVGSGYILCVLGMCRPQGYVFHNFGSSPICCWSLSVGPADHNLLQCRPRPTCAMVHVHAAAQQQQQGRGSNALCVGVIPGSCIESCSGLQALASEPSQKPGKIFSD